MSDQVLFAGLDSDQIFRRNILAFGHRLDAVLPGGRKVRFVDIAKTILAMDDVGGRRSAVRKGEVEAEIISAVQNAGYGASRRNAQNQLSPQDSILNDTQTPIIKKRLVVSLFFLIVLMYFSMGHTMWHFPLPSFFEGNYLALGLAQLILSGCVMVINQKFFISGFKSLFHRSPNMDTLVALGSSASFVYSTYALFLMTAAVSAEEAMAYSHEFYFESSAMILTLITVGKMLEARSKGKTTDALKQMIPKKLFLSNRSKQVMFLWFAPGRVFRQTE